MTPLQCLFCDQGNPAESKFCNECGTPLHFKPCPQCDGINGRFAASCYRCGAAFSALGRDAPAESLSPQPDASDDVPALASRWERLSAASIPVEEMPSAPDPMPLPVTHDRIPWRALSTALLAATIVLAAVAWQADRANLVQARYESPAPHAAPVASEPQDAKAVDVAAVPALHVASADEPAPTVAEPEAAAEAVVAPAPAPGRTAQKSRSTAKPTASRAATAYPPLTVVTADSLAPRASKANLAQAPQAPVVAARTVTRQAPAARPTRDALLTASLACAEGTSLARSCDVRALAKGN